jgi:excinuclease ABC subunit C
VAKVRELINFVKATIQLRTCKLNLTESNIAKGKFKVCLEYHLGNCKGPCEGLQTLQDYEENLEQLKNILKGNLAPVIHHFRNEMKGYASSLEFEKADIVRKKIEHLEHYESRSVVVSRQLTNADVFSLLRDGNDAYVNYLMVQNGTIVQTHTSKLEIPLEETDEDILAFAISQLRSAFNSLATEIVVPFSLEYPEPGVIVTVPKGGDKRKLLDLSETNVNYFLQEINKRKMLRLEGKDDMERKKVLYQLQQDLQLPDLPTHIECFDNSNFQGSYPVSAMVCFVDGMPSKKDYRHYNVKTVQGINDFATMKEVVHRRYRRLTEEQLPLPQLVIIDGGKGQLHAAMESLFELNLGGRMTVVGLAKNEEEIFFAGDKEPVRLPYNSESLKLIRRIRDEVHRFGITFHRTKRSKGTFFNELENIKGIGKNTADQLLKTFKSVKNIKDLSEDELGKVVGSVRAKIIRDFFHPKDHEESPNINEAKKEKGPG